METEPSPDEENVAADTHDRHVFVRFVSMFCNKNAAAFKEASISLGAQLKSVDKGAGVLRTSQAEVMVGLEAIFLVDSTDDVVQLSITPQLGEKAWTGAIPLAGLYARRNEIMVDIGDKRGSAKVVLKCYGFGKQVPVADTSILPMPALPDVEVTSLDLMLYPYTAQVKEPGAPSDPQFWDEFEVAIQRNKGVAASPPVTTMSVQVKGVEKKFKVNVAYFRAFCEAWKSSRVHKISIKDTNADAKEEKQRICVVDHFWSTLVAIVVVARAAYKTENSYRKNEVVDHVFEERRTGPCEAKVLETHSDGTYTIEHRKRNGHGRHKKQSIESHVDAKFLRRWKDRQNYKVVCTANPKYPLWVSMKEWVSAVEQWCLANKLDILNNGSEEDQENLVRGMIVSCKIVSSRTRKESPEKRRDSKDSVERHERRERKRSVQISQNATPHLDAKGSRELAPLVSSKTQVSIEVATDPKLFAKHSTEQDNRTPSAERSRNRGPHRNHSDRTKRKYSVEARRYSADRKQHSTEWGSRKHSVERERRRQERRRPSTERRKYSSDARRKQSADRSRKRSTARRKQSADPPKRKHTHSAEREYYTKHLAEPGKRSAEKKPQASQLRAQYLDAPHLREL